ncbi:MAG: CPBP family intramembrane metalloprotease [Candidatus Omnitrophica bacterium]|nr:CPBP family intramembrane metalloprotease [Candidatus Omnitrophota bacterium]
MYRRITLSIRTALRAVRAERLYIFMIIFMLIMHFSAFMADKAGDQIAAEGAVVEGKVPDKSAESLTIFDPGKIAEREEKLRTKLLEDPGMAFFVVTLNLAVIFFIFVGVFLDIYLLKRFIRKEPLNIRIVSGNGPSWKLRDVLRVSVIFLFAGHVFILLQGAMNQYMPFADNDNFQMIFNTMMINIVAVSVIFYYVIVKYRQKPEDLGISIKRSELNLLYGAIGYIALLPVVILIIMATYIFIRVINYVPPVQPIVQVFLDENSAGVLWSSVIFAAFFGPLAEELFFRGFMYPALRKKFGILGGVFITSGVFSLLHFHAVGFLPILALGVLLTYIYEKTGSIFTPIAIHIFHNIAMVVMVFMVRELGIY